MRADGIETTILGSTLYPLVSSSKNRKRPALDAGNGAPFFLLGEIIDMIKSLQ